MPQLRSLEPEQVTNVKELIGTGLSLHAVADKAGVSYSTAWHISKGKYDSLVPLVTKTKTEFFNEMSHENWLA